MVKKKKRKYNLQSFQNQFTDIVNEHKHELPIFNNTTKYNCHKLNFNSWFTNKKYITPNKTTANILPIDELEVTEYKCIKIKMILADIHKQILQRWFKATTYMYNETLTYLRTNYPLTKTTIIKTKVKNAIKSDKTFLDKYYIRNKMNKQRTKIQKMFIYTIDKQYTKNNKNIKCKLDAHSFDKVIFQLIQNIKSAKTNLLRGNIKKFRLKYWKYTRPSQVLEFEKRLFSDGIFYPSLFTNLPEIKYYYNGKQVTINKMNSDFKINYNAILDEYTLLLSEIPDIENITNKEKIITLDPGLKVFMSGLTENSYTRIGIKVNKIISADLNKLNIIKNNPKIPNSIKKKYEKRINKNIYNKVDDLHWKTIKYLTNNYSTIFLGDMSAKGIVSKKNSCISKLMKIAALRTRYYDFRKRLEYKCSITNTNYKLINEMYTSKTCSNCGAYKRNLKGEEIYDCRKCKTSLDRDCNGCRNIYMRQYVIEQE